MYISCKDLIINICEFKKYNTLSQLEKNIKPVCGLIDPTFMF